MSLLCNAIGGTSDKLRFVLTMVALRAFLVAAACKRQPNHGHSPASRSLGLAIAQSTGCKPLSFYPLLCRSYLLAYNSHQLKDIFNVHTLDLAGVSKSFGFAVPPRVSLNLESKAAHGRKAKANAADYKHGKSGHAFSAGNPYGTKQVSDRRQFSRA